MAIVIGAHIEVQETTMGQALVQVHNTETVQLGAPALQPLHGDLFAEVIERLGEDVKERAMEQVRQMLKAQS
jgi:hypothetical protein